MMKKTWLVLEAKKWVGVHETSDNRGPIVDRFISATGGSPGNPWCVSFIRFCLDRIDRDFVDFYGFDHDESPKSIVTKTHAVLTLWDKAPAYSKSLAPASGLIVCWQHYDEKGRATGKGHAGIVERALDDGRYFDSIEGNTSTDSADIDREGDGVCQRVRFTGGSPRFRLMGFIDPWAKKP